MRRVLNVSIFSDNATWIKHCNGNDAHRASIMLDEMPTIRDEDGCFPFWETDSISKEAWPKTCAACGCLFDNFTLRTDDKWRVFRHICPYEIMTDGTQKLLTHEMPVGAMWWSVPISPDKGSQYWKARGAGNMLIVRTPGGDCNLDRPSAGGPGWEWTGNPPNVTATPSIWCDQPNGWHGYVKEGKLVPA
jgi:hypothetical protein